MEARPREQRRYRIPGERRPRCASSDPPLPRPPRYLSAEQTVHVWLVYWMATIPGEVRSLRWMAQQAGVSRMTVQRAWESFAMTSRRQAIQPQQKKCPMA